MIIGEFTTRNFDFVTCGASKEECVNLFQSAWKKHKKEYGAPMDSWLDDLILDENWEEVADNFRWYDAKPGVVYRDGDILYERS